MRTDYKNWMPKGMVLSFAAGSAVCLALALLADRGQLFGGAAKSAAVLILALLGIGLALAALWCLWLYRTFSYEGSRKIAKYIIEGVASYVDIPEGGIGLDVGCGSGALAIAAAKRNPGAKVLGIDRWGKEYASFSNQLCENNAEAEGVGERTEFRRGDALKLDIPDESMDAVMSNYVYHNIPSKDRQAILLETLRTLKKGGSFAIHDIMSTFKYGDMESFVRKLRDMGYEDVRLIDTSSGMFVGKLEGRLMGLSGSMLLTGKK